MRILNKDRFQLITSLFLIFIFTLKLSCNVLINERMFVHISTIVFCFSKGVLISEDYSYCDWILPHKFRTHREFLGWALVQIVYLFFFVLVDSLFPFSDTFWIKPTPFLSDVFMNCLSYSLISFDSAFIRPFLNFIRPKRWLIRPKWKLIRPKLDIIRPYCDFILPYSRLILP